MNRKVLLIEPNYRNKYPPMGLMKISTYYKMLGDEVTFFKGDLRELVLETAYEDLLEQLYANDETVFWEEYKQEILTYLKKGTKSVLDDIPLVKDNIIISKLFAYYRKYYYSQEYFNPENRKWDRVGVTTLFTFYWDITIDTINFAKKLCKDEINVMIGGVMASILPDEIKKETGIIPFVGTLSVPGVLDDNDIIIDLLPLDYSILEEIDYEYPAKNSYYGYMTRGCVNNCSFCSVPKLEPEYKSHIPIHKQIDDTNARFGEKKDLLLLDNNVLASCQFNEIIDEIKDSGFTKGSTFTPLNLFEIAIQNLREGYNDKGYIKSVVKQYKQLISKYDSEPIQEVYNLLDENKLLSVDTAKKENILECYDAVKDWFEKFYKRAPRKRIVDFNQGIDARLITDENMERLAEIPIRPVRIAFDNWKNHRTYEAAVRTAVDHGLKDLSNYLLYNYKDKPVELYRRLELNIDLCEELGASIYSFPMKYHPIEDPKYFKNRDYIGKHWNRKYIRTIQAVLNATKGKVGKGGPFFREAFGKDETEFEKLLYMPETMIIYRMHFKHNGTTEKWWRDFSLLPEKKLKIIKLIIHANDFTNIEQLSSDSEILDVLSYYTIRRKDAERE